MQNSLTISRGAQGCKNVLDMQQSCIVHNLTLSKRAQKRIQHRIDGKYARLSHCIDAIQGNKYLEKKYSSLYDMQTIRVCKNISPKKSSLDASVTFKESGSALHKAFNGQTLLRTSKSKPTPVKYYTGENCNTVIQSKTFSLIHHFNVSLPDVIRHNPKEEALLLKVKK